VAPTGLFLRLPTLAVLLALTMFRQTGCDGSTMRALSPDHQWNALCFENGSKGHHNQRVTVGRAGNQVVMGQAAATRHRLVR